MRNEPWVWPKVGDAGTSGAGAVPLRSAQMMGKQKKRKKERKKEKKKKKKRKKGGTETGYFSSNMLESNKINVSASVLHSLNTPLTAFQTSTELFSIT